jgi:hypothetical protein
MRALTVTPDAGALDREIVLQDGAVLGSVTLEGFAEALRPACDDVPVVLALGD